MVFRWLFGGSGSSSRGEEPSVPDEDPVFDDRLGPGDSTPVVEQGPASLSVPLTTVPSFLVDDRPELRLTPYDMGKSQYAANVQALVHNAVRLEMADMWGDILPSLQSRCEGGENGLSTEDADDIRDWWSGFARFALTSSLVDDMINKKAYDDVYIGFDKDTKAIQKMFLKVQEKNNVHLETAVKRMAKAVSAFEDNISVAGFTGLVKAWEILAAILADIYADSEELVKAIDRWVRNPFEYKDLEKNATKIFTSKKRWGDDDSKRGEMIVILCRWVGTEELMREWMFRNLTKKELRSIDRWMDDYRDKRLAIIDRFHQKKA